MDDAVADCGSRRTRPRASSSTPSSGVGVSVIGRCDRRRCVGDGRRAAWRAVVRPDLDVVVARGAAGPVSGARAPRRSPCGSCSRPARVEDRELLADDRCSPVVAGPGVRRTVSVDVRPSRIATVRWTCSDTSGSWVTITIVVPSSSLTRRRSPKISVEVVVSSSPVGSSAKRTSGSLASATAIGDPLLLAARECVRAGGRAARRGRRARGARAPARRALAPAVERHRQLDVLRAVRYGRRFRAVCCQIIPTTRRR